MQTCKVEPYVVAADAYVVSAHMAKVPASFID